MKSKTLISQDVQIQSALLQRGEDANTIELRDLKRYYALLNYHLIELYLNQGECQLICEALKDYRIEDDPEQARTIWKQIHAAIVRDNLDRKWNVDRETFHSKIQGLNHSQAFALVDAVERYWVRAKSQPQESLQARLLSVDLIKCCDSAL